MTKLATRVAPEPPVAGGARSPRWSAGWLLIALVLWAGLARAASIKSSGSLAAPGARIMVISTDPLFQEVLNGDFGAARTAAGAQTLTLTVSVLTRVLTPDLTIDEIAPGVPAAAGLLRAAGYRPDTLEEPQAASSAEPPDIAAYMSNGGPPPEQRDNLTAEQLFQYQGRPGTIPELPRDAMVGHTETPVPAGTYDTALVAHAVLSSGADMTVVAVTLPGEDLEAAKKLMAERIVNSVLH